MKSSAVSSFSDWPRETQCLSGRIRSDILPQAGGGNSWLNIALVGVMSVGWDYIGVGRTRLSRGLSR